MTNSERIGPEDAVLVARGRRGEEEALVGLYERHRAGAFRYARRLLRDTHWAEEVLQEAFAYLFTPAGLAAAARGRFVTLLYRVVRHRAIDRSERERFRRTSPLGPTTDPPGREAGPGERVETAEEVERIRRTLAELPDHEREAIELRILSGLSVKQTAEVLAVPEGTVKSRLHNGLDRLRRLLGAGAPPGRESARSDGRTGDRI